MKFLIPLIALSALFSEGSFAQITVHPQDLFPANQMRHLEEVLFSKKQQTDSVLIVKSGKLIYEHYRAPYARGTKHLAWSVTKSVMSALVGIAESQGLLKRTDSVCETFVEFKGSAQCAITLAHLLTMTSGLTWQESYEGTHYTKSSVISMLYGEGRKDMGRFVLSHELEYPPGQEWKYSSGTTNLIAQILKRAVEKKNPGESSQFPWTALFNPLEFDHPILERDETNSWIGASYLYATPLDFAKFGQLYLQDGMWKGKRLIPAEWIKFSVTPPVGFEKMNYGTGKLEMQGAQWWLNHPIPSRRNQVPLPHMPRDLFFAQGHWGQRIFVIPSQQLVIVRTANDRDPGIYFDQTFLDLVFEALGIPFYREATAEQTQQDAPIENQVKRPLKEYSQSMLRMLPRFRAKEFCSCLFGMALPEAYCDEYSLQGPRWITSTQVDYKTKSVRARTALLFTSAAQWIDEDSGCRFLE